MNEEIEYAKMLEIPVSTINVFHKNKKLKFHANDLKEKLIAKVNDEALETNSAPLLERNGDEINTVRVGTEEETPKWQDEELLQDELSAFDAEQSKKERRASKILNVEFAVACALCGAIFLTNVFMPNSAINTFFTSLVAPKEEQADARTYTDFELGSVLGAYSDIALELSETGVITFTGEGCVYPVADGTVADVHRAEDGTYTLTLAYSDTFQGVIGGLDYVYYQQGETVKANVPVGFSKGETQVQVTLSAEGELLNCFEVDETNCLTWIESQE